MFIIQALFVGNSQLRQSARARDHNGAVPAPRLFLATALALALAAGFGAALAPFASPIGLAPAL